MAPRSPRSRGWPPLDGGTPAPPRRAPALASQTAAGPSGSPPTWWCRRARCRQARADSALRQPVRPGAGADHAAQARWSTWAPFSRPPPAPPRSLHRERLAGCLLTARRAAFGSRAHTHSGQETGASHAHAHAGGGDAFQAEDLRHGGARDGRPGQGLGARSATRPNPRYVRRVAHPRRQEPRPTRAGRPAAAAAAVAGGVGACAWRGVGVAALARFARWAARVCVGAPPPPACGMTCAGGGQVWGARRVVCSPASP